MKSEGTRVLYRAAPVENPYFGRGSYWTHRLAFAQEFKDWLDGIWVGPHTVYSAEVHLTDLVDFPATRRLPSEVINKRVPDFAAAGAQWITFYEGVYRGVVDKQYVYLGETPIATTEVLAHA